MKAPREDKLCLSLTFLSYTHTHSKKYQGESEFARAESTSGFFTYQLNRVSPCSRIMHFYIKIILI